MPAYCPTCRGLMRPERGALVCIKCSLAGRARTILSGGRRIHLAGGQAGLGTLPPSAGNPTLSPQAPSWRPAHGSAGPGATGSSALPAMQPHPQLGLFPFDTIRDTQRRLTRDVTMAVQGGRHLVAQAPTGLGKTAASLAPALECALAAGKTVMFLTSRQSQHRIAVETLRTIQERRGVSFTLVDLVAKRDMCLRPEASELPPARFPDFCSRETRSKSCRFLGEPGEMTLDEVRRGVLHVEELMHVSRQGGICPHIVAMRAAKEAQVIVADYNHLFSDLRDASLEKLGKNLGDLILVVDEAHNLPDRIRGSHAHKVTPFLLDNAESEARGEKARDVEADIQALRRALNRIADQCSKGGRAERSRVGSDEQVVARLEVEELQVAWELERSSLLGAHRTLEDMAESLQAVVTKLKKAADDVVSCESLMAAVEDWGRFRTGALRFLQWVPGGQVELMIRLLDPSIVARAVLNGVHSAILMSGTLRPPEMMRDLLGLAPERTAVRSYASPFPAANRLVVVAQGYSTRYQARDEALWQRIAATVRETAAACRGNLAVFAPSYAILREVQAHVGETGKLVITEESGWGKAERDQVLDTLEGARRDRHGKPGTGGILFGVVGGSFAEGVDFKHNLLCAVIVVGLPLAPPDLEVDASIGYLERKFPGNGRAYGYIYPAMNRVLQAMGRPIRGPDDKAVILLLDERYLGPPYRQLLPDGVVGTADPAALAAKFLRSHGL